MRIEKFILKTILFYIFLDCILKPDFAYSFCIHNFDPTAINLQSYLISILTIWVVSKNAILSRQDHAE